MRISKVKATPVRVPVTRKGVMSRAIRTHVSRTIVEVETADGLIGVGETRGEWAAPIVNERFASKLVGIDAADRFAAQDACLLPHVDYGFPELVMDKYAFAAVEIALWDILGKRAGLPLYQLLGGAVRDKAPFVAYAYTVDPEEKRTPAEIPGIMAEIARTRVASSGARLFEFKVGRNSIECEIETVRAIRAALDPGVEIAIDANMGYTLPQARRFLDGIRGIRLENFEEPTAELAELDLLRRDYGVPVSTHCWHLDALKPYPAIDSVVTDIHLHGGIGPVSEFFQKVGAGGRRIWIRSMWELGISWAAMCHLGLARPELDRPAQSLIDWIADDLVEGEPWHVRDGGVRPPEAPGLGVTLDRAALARYAVG